MALQVSEGFNGSTRSKLEQYVRKLARKYANVYISTGPLYLLRGEKDGKSHVKYRAIGRITVAVPTHFLKVAVMVDKCLEMKSYVVPNQPVCDDPPLQPLRVAIESI